MIIVAMLGVATSETKKIDVDYRNSNTTTSRPLFT